MQDILSRLLQVFLIFLIISLTYLLKCTDMCEFDVMESSVYVSLRLNFCSEKGNISRELALGEQTYRVSTV